MTNRPAEPGRTARLPIVRSAMFGHAIADAMGVPVEFSTRSQRRCDPVTGYRGYGAHDVPAGTWSDDTSMALATNNQGANQCCNANNTKAIMAKA